MQGIIFNLVEESVLRTFGDEAWEEILDQADVAGVYASTGDYDDAELLAIAGAAADHLGMTLPDLLRSIGTMAFHGLERRYPQFMERASGSVDFLRQVESFIHPEVLKLYPNAVPPKFRFEDLDGGGTRLIYSSRRDLHYLAEGMILGVAEFFDEELTIERPDLDLPEGSTAFDLFVHSYVATS